jgi:hypothetical protein
MVLVNEIQQHSKPTAQKTELAISGKNSKWCKGFMGIL